jgi:hypothetical protein
MKIPNSELALLIRTDFSNPFRWMAICVAATTPNRFGFSALIQSVDDQRFEGWTKEQIMSNLPHNYRYGFVFVADTMAIQHLENPVLCIDLLEEPGATVRVIPTEIWCMENNLSISNMSFDEFREAAGRDGIFRGF